MSVKLSGDPKRSNNEISTVSSSGVVTKTMNSPKYVCAQTGARRSYAIPATLAKAGLLERFYTDSAGNVGWGRLLSAGASVFGRTSSFARLKARQVPEIVRPFTKAYVREDIRQIFRNILSDRSAVAQSRDAMRRSNSLAETYAECGFGAATHFYTMMDEMFPLKIAAKKRNLTVVAEIYIVPSFAQIMQEERRRFPEWEPAAPDLSAVRKEVLPKDSIFVAVDYFVCPSMAVKEDVCRTWNVRDEQVILIPYGMSADWLQLEPKTVPGRVLFVGSADLRKGIHYLAEAANILTSRGRQYEFVIAGNVMPETQGHPKCSQLRFLGRVPRAHIAKEFQSADLFVLPSLAEGSAEVTYEALASGLPLVTTKAAGSVARDGIEGLIVAERDAQSLADAIDRIIQNRTLRNQFSEAARERARDFTYERYGERLLKRLTTLDSPNLDVE